MKLYPKNDGGFEHIPSKTNENSEDASFKMLAPRQGAILVYLNPSVSLCVTQG